MSDYQISFQITPEAMALISYDVAYRKKPVIFSFPQLPYQPYQVPLSELKPLHLGEHVSEHFYILAAPFPSSALQLSLQNHPPSKTKFKTDQHGQGQHEEVCFPIKLAYVWMAPDSANDLSFSG